MRHDMTSLHQQKRLNGPHVRRWAIAAALSNPEAWLEVRVDGVALVPRQRLVAVSSNRFTFAMEPASSRVIDW